VAGIKKRMTTQNRQKGERLKKSKSDERFVRVSYFKNDHRLNRLTAVVDL